MSKLKKENVDIDPQIKDLFNLSGHLGHKSNRIHPKAKKYIYKILNGVSIIDLVKTVQLLNKAIAYINEISSQSKTILFVTTKKNIVPLIKKIYSDNNLNYVIVKWPAGLLSNFETLLKNINKLKTMKEEKESGGWDKFVKHEQIALQKKLNRLHKFYGGLLSLVKMPDALFIVDTKREKTAILEAKKTGVKIIAIVDTNVDPDLVDYPIPLNDDSPEAVEYIIKKIVEAYVKKS